MKSRKFPTFEDALAYLKEAGEVKYSGRIGERYEWCVYNLTVDVKVYHIKLHNDGTLVVFDETYKRD